MNIIRKTPDVTPPINRVEVSCVYLPKNTLVLDRICDTEDGPKQCRVAIRIGVNDHAIVMSKADALEFAAALNEIFG